MSINCRPMLIGAAATLGLLTGTTADACTRVMFQGDKAVMTARSMDWSSDVKSNLWVFPRGIARTGQTTKNPYKWTSKYGSVVTAAFDVGTTDGMNERGLAANLLWLAESEYPAWDGTKPGMSIAVWTQYVLDNFATVKEAVAGMESAPFVIATGGFPGQEELKATLHLAVSDASGDSAIFEFIKGKLVVHHDPSYHVMTNSPVYDQQLALAAYWNGIGGTAMLPGTSRAADRFVRASYYAGLLPKDGDTASTLAGIFSVIRNASVPIGVSSPGQPNISSTLWRTVSDHKNLVYYFESSHTPNTFGVDLKKFDLSVDAQTKKLEMTGGQIYAGEVSSQFKPAEPFKIR
ncbi:linear amide C-N hydrolase [Sphingopyxis indica]|uniref:Penicillin amidase Cysteine peptidase. MEROPS family C59 n=1 Tax=Sphingopyxis indica TaxID=436663 RepID=A0A239EHW9_9SPHN|nr:linear amide C-N hydrolase [Sphingopyxis indica]SNS43623.1 penicillin amidase Cysteine peptidase. MEROPS family C59 [Sphingopyxis indica]